MAEILQFKRPEEAEDPHLVFPVLGGDVHVIPVSLIEDWIAGKHLDSLRDPQAEVLLRSIINDWKVRGLNL